MPAQRITIQIQSVSDIKVSKNNREYFTLKDMAQTQYVCFNPKLHPFCQLGGEIDADIEPAKSEGGTPRLTMVYKDGKPVIQAPAKEKQRSSWGKSDKELGQELKIAEMKRHSIEAQVSLKSAIDLAIGGLMPIPKESSSIDISIVQELIKDTAREFYQLLQSLTEISDVEVIHKTIKEAKIETQTSEKVKGNKADAIEPPKPTPTPSPSNGEVPTSKELLFAWIKTHKKLTSDAGVLSFIQNVLKINPDRLDTDVPGVYKEIKELTNWN